MIRAISKNLRWDGSVLLEPRTFDLLKFFAPREGLRVSGLFADLLPWVVYTHQTACGRVFADCYDLRRAIAENRLPKELPTGRRFRVFEGLCLVASLIGQQFGGKEGWLLADGSLNVFLLDIGGQVLAVSVSCLDGDGEFYVDDWWPLIDRVGPLRAHDRVFSFNPSKSLPSALPPCPLRTPSVSWARRWITNTPWQICCAARAWTLMPRARLPGLLVILMLFHVKHCARPLARLRPMR